MQSFAATEIGLTSFACIIDCIRCMLPCLHMLRLYAGGSTVSVCWHLLKQWQGNHCKQLVPGTITAAGLQFVQVVWLLTLFVVSHLESLLIFDPCLYLSLSMIRLLLL